MDIRLERTEQSRILGGKALAEAAPLLSGETEVFLIFDAQVAHLAGELVSAVPSIRGTFAITASEEDKSMDTVLLLERALLDAGASRKALLVALGGGITTDLTGFAASIYKRGIRYANIPTTLLAQVDAAIGGKTGVNFEGYKNMLGAIVQPQWTFLCTEVLRTLPRREWRCGAAEMLKTFLLENRDDSYERAVRLLSEVPGEAFPGEDFDWDALQGLILSAASVKAGIVGRDPFEKGERRLLNLGHTFAHALEHLSLISPEPPQASPRSANEAASAARPGPGLLPQAEAVASSECSQAKVVEGIRPQGVTGGCPPFKHGEAVSIGIILAARLAERLSLAEKGLSERLKADFAACGLPTESPVPPEALVDAMEKDKKAEGTTVRFILPTAIGCVRQVPLGAADAAAGLQDPDRTEQNGANRP